MICKSNYSVSHLIKHMLCVTQRPIGGEKRKERKKDICKAHKKHWEEKVPSVWDLSGGDAVFGEGRLWADIESDGLCFL